MKPPLLTELAPAKVNLTLCLTGLRADGLHLLDSLVVFADVGDLVTVAPAQGLSLTVTGPRAAGVPVDGSNLVLRAAEHLRRLRNVTAGAAITLDKHLPHGGGVGGGSSDAAAALRLLARLWTVEPLTGDEALALGADLPVCLAAPAPRVMSGIGEVLRPAPDLPAGWFVLVNPGVTVATRAVFAAHDLDHGFDPAGLQGCDESLTPDTFAGWLEHQRNDLTKVVCTPRFALSVGDIIAQLRASTGCKAANMSGSGSTCWGWFSNIGDARVAALRIGTAAPDWWIAVARVLRPGDQLSRDTT